MLCSVHPGSRRTLAVKEVPQADPLCQNHRETDASEIAAHFRSAAAEAFPVWVDDGAAADFAAAEAVFALRVDTHLSPVVLPVVPFREVLRGESALPSGIADSFRQIGEHNGYT